jgi:His/Glu/Gln/Arg/opine family amino acid ABC transporter permease subunit
MSELGEIHIDPEQDAAPLVPAHGPVDWMKKNLFSSRGNSVLTVVFGALALIIIRWLMGLIFEGAVNWNAVATNLRLLFTYNYPSEQYIRIWFSVGVLFVAIGLSIAAWGVDPRIPVKKLASNAMSLGGFLIVGAAIAPPDVPGSVRVGLLVVGVVLVAIGFGANRAFGEQSISFLALLSGIGAFWIAVAWLVPFGRNEFADGALIDEPGTINPSTKVPWTILILLLLATVVAGRALVRVVSPQLLRMTMVIFWVIGPAFLIFLVLRDPAFDWDKVVREDLPIAAAFLIIGSAVLYWLTDPKLGELGRGVAAFLVGLAAFQFVAAFLGLYGVQQKVRISFVVLALFALAAPTFAGEKAARYRFVGAWVGTVLLGHWLITGINTESTLDIAAPPFLGGFALTLSISYYVMLASFPLGIILALGRTSKMPIFRVLSTLYIEFVRGVPLITILFFFSVILNLFLPNGMEVSELAAVFLGYALFSAAYMAENIRGGLQSIRRGQFEASDALGLTTAQRTIFIVLPQALRVTIPNLVGQAIATFKETSLIAIVGGFDLLRVANSSIPSQPGFLGQNRPALLFICLIYWVFSYSMSRASRSLETKLGVGTR